MSDDVLRNRGGLGQKPSDSVMRRTLPELQRIGYWSSNDDSELPDPRTLVDVAWEATTRDRVVEYLRAGRVQWIQMGYSTSRFCGMPNGTAELTDGTYLWPEGLAHHLTDHAVRLPDEFVAFVTAFEGTNSR